jgi:hypothetical protein
MEAPERIDTHPDQGSASIAHAGDLALMVSAQKNAS